MLTLKKDISSAFESLALLKQDVHDWYIKYAKSAEHPEMLDSFLFQRKLLDMEYDHYHKMNQYIENRTYGDYYKLFTSMYNYCKNDYAMDIEKYPVYKDLEPYKVYGNAVIEELYGDIKSYLHFLESTIAEKKNELNEHHKKIAKGLNIGNYFNIMEHQVSLMTDQLKLFNNHFSSIHFNSECPNSLAIK